MNALIFDIETIPDVEAGRAIYDLPADHSDEAVAEFMFEKQREKTGSDFLPTHLHRVVVISAVLQRNNKVTVWSLGDESASEADIVQRFFHGIEKYTPTLVSWNGSAFDCPVLHYRCLKHGIAAPRYWDTGEQNSQFKWNNYISRYHQRHTDVMDMIAAYQPRAFAPLDQVASMLGFPGKMGMDGSKVWEAYCRGEIQAIRDYCETDVLNTYLVFLRFELMRGNILADEYERYTEQLRAYLESEDQSHFKDFLAAWQTDAVPCPAE